MKLGLNENRIKMSETLHNKNGMIYLKNKRHFELMPQKTNPTVTVKLSTSLFMCHYTM